MVKGAPNFSLSILSFGMGGGRKKPDPSPKRALRINNAKAKSGLLPEAPGEKALTMAGVRRINVKESSCPPKIGGDLRLGRA